MAVKNQALLDRTKKFALRVIRAYSALPKSPQAQILGKQLLRSATSVAANYREAGRARSDAELKSKLGIVEQELDESLLWMELLVESGLIERSRMQELMGECNELLSIVVTAIKTIKHREM